MKLSVGWSYTTNNGLPVTILRTVPNPDYPGDSSITSSGEIRNGEVPFYYVGSNGIWYLEDGATWTEYSADPSSILGNSHVDTPRIKFPGDR